MFRHSIFGVAVFFLCGRFIGRFRTKVTQVEYASTELMQELAAPNRMTAVESLFTEDILRVLNLDLRKRSVGRIWTRA